jgi:hypothetical protein
MAEPFCASTQSATASLPMALFEKVWVAGFGVFVADVLP